MYIDGTVLKVRQTITRSGRLSSLLSIRDKTARVVRCNLFCPTDKPVDVKQGDHSEGRVWMLKPWSIEDRHFVDLLIDRNDVFICSAGSDSEDKPKR